MMKKILIFLLVLCSAVTTMAQNDTTKYTTVNGYGQNFNRIKGKLAIVFPTDTAQNKLPGSIAVINGVAYVKETSAWLAIGANALDTAALLSTVVRTFGTQSVAGSKTFTDSIRFNKTFAAYNSLAIFGTGNSAVKIGYGLTSDVTQLKLGDSFHFLRNGGAPPEISVVGNGLLMYNNYLSVYGGVGTGHPGEIRLAGNFSLEVARFGAYNTATSSLYFGNSASDYANLQITYSRNTQWMVNDTSTIPTYNASALVSLQSTKKGFLLPRMTTTQRNAISSPATGLEVYNTTTNTKNYYNGTTWVELAAGNFLQISDTAAMLANYPLINGTRATGTWNISVTGNAGTVTNGVYTTTFNTLGDARYLQLTGGTLTGALEGTSADFSGAVSTGNLGAANVTSAGNVSGNAFIKFGGTSSQFLKADGSVDANTYATTASLGSYVPYTGATTNVNLGVYELTASVFNGQIQSFLTNVNTNYYLPLISSNAAADEYLYTSANSPRVNGSTGAMTLVGALSGTNGTFTGQFTMASTSGTNVGVGTTPSAWASTWKVLQVQNSAFASLSSQYTFVGQNWYNDGASKYIGTGRATLYQQFDGEHSFFTSPSGTAGGTISFTEALTIKNSGNVGIGTTSPSSYYATNLVVSAGSEGGITIANTGTTGAQYLAFADGTTGADRFRGYLTYNHTDNSMSMAVDAAIKFKILSAGRFLFNTETDDGSSIGQFAGDVLLTKAGNLNLVVKTTSNNTPYFSLSRNSGSNGIFGAYVNSSSETIFENQNGTFATFATTGAATFSSTLGINGVSDNVKGTTYTPTFTNIANSSNFTGIVSQYIRVGNTVTVSGYVTFDAAASGLVQFRGTLPVSSALTATGQLAGTGAVSLGGSYVVSEIVANAANDASQFSLYVTGAGTYSVSYSFTYQIL